jgi:hypothetical protein
MSQAHAIAVILTGHDIIDVVEWLLTEGPMETPLDNMCIAATFVLMESTLGRFDDVQHCAMADMFDKEVVAGGFTKNTAVFTDIFLNKVLFYDTKRLFVCTHSACHVLSD